MKNDSFDKTLLKVSGAFLLFAVLVWLNRNSEPLSSIPSPHLIDFKADTSQNVWNLQTYHDIPFSAQDTIFFYEYRIIRTVDSLHSRFPLYGIEVQRDGSIEFRLDNGVPRPQFVRGALLPVLNSNNEQLLIERFSGGAHCCWSYWLLALRYSADTLFESDKYPELGYELAMKDLDNDGKPELLQSIIAFDYFDRLPHVASPFSRAVFKYSPESDRFKLANRAFPKIILGDTLAAIRHLQAVADSVNAATFKDANGAYLHDVVQLVIDFAYAGQRERGWSLFDQLYILRDKETMRSKIDTVLNRSKIYQELYSVDKRKRSRD
jgi:hypothetical protein